MNRAAFDKAIADLNAHGKLAGPQGDAGPQGPAGPSGTSGAPTTGLVAWYRTGGVDLAASFNTPVSPQSLTVSGSVSSTYDRFGNPNAALLFTGTVGSGTTSWGGSNSRLPTGGADRTISAWFQTTTDFSSGGTGDLVNWGTNATNERAGLIILASGNSDYFVGQSDDDAPPPDSCRDG